MGEYKSADQIPLDKAIEAIMTGALRAVDAQGDAEVGGFMFEVIAGGKIGPRGGSPGRPGPTLPGSTAAPGGTAGGQAAGG